MTTSPRRLNSRRPGSFGARACRQLRVRLLRDGPEGLPRSFRVSWIMQRIIATPPWVDMKAIRAIYEEAARLTEATGVKHNVDHIVPLNHPAVCGLHVPWNLEPLPKRVNAAKSNSWNPDQLELFEV